MAYLITAIIMTLSVLGGDYPIQAFSSGIFMVRRTVPLHMQSFLSLQISQSKFTVAHTLWNCTVMERDGSHNCIFIFGKRHEVP